jgi:hypothetical protein
MQQILPVFFAPLATANPKQTTERSGKGWTLHQTMAHVSAVADIYNKAIDAALNGKPFTYPGWEKRTDLRKVNEREINLRADIPLHRLYETLLELLDWTCTCGAALSPEQLALSAHIHAYNRPMTVSELISAQLAHIGVIHAAQLANGMGKPPLWSHYTPDLMQRQLTRCFNVISHAYWIEHGGALKANINIRIGMRGSVWHLILAPDGGTSGEGEVKRPTLTIWTRSEDELCRLLTVQYPIWETILRGKVLMWGNVLLALKMRGDLFEN